MTMAMGNIARLKLSWCDLESAILVQIVCSCPRLSTLVLSHLYIEPLTDRALQQVTANCLHIVHLKLLDAMKITDAGILSVVQNLKGLRNLNIMDVPLLTDASLVHIYTHCAGSLQLLMFNYDRCDAPQFSDSAINTLLESCTKLHTLYFDDKYKGATPLKLSSTAILNLSTLVICGDVVSGKNIATIATCGGQLQGLEVSSKNIHESVFELACTCPKLRKLHYDFCCPYNEAIPENLVRASEECNKPGLRVTLKKACSGFSWKPTEPTCFDF